MRVTKQKIAVLLVIMAVLIACIAGCMILLHRPAANAVAESNGMELFSVSSKTVDRITIRYEDETLELEKKDDTWYIPGSSMQINQTRAATIVTYVSHVFVTKAAEEGVTDFAKYDLDPPKTIVEVHTTDGQEYTLSYGAFSPDQKSVYLRVDDEDIVYMQGSGTPELIMQTMDSMKDLTMEKGEAADLSEIFYVNDFGETVRIRALPEKEVIGNSTWMMETPYHLYVQNSVIDSFRILVNAMGIRDFVSEDIREEYGLDEASARDVTFTYADGTKLSLKVGALDEENGVERYYCLVDGKDGVYRINRSSFEYLQYTALQMVSPYVLPAEKEDLQEMTVTAEGSVYTFTRQDDGTLLLNDVPLDADTSEAFMLLTKYMTIVDTTEDEAGDAVGEVVQKSTTGAEVAVTIREYNKEYYAVDYGYPEGAQVYIAKDGWDTFLRGTKGESGESVPAEEPAAKERQEEPAEAEEPAAEKRQEEPAEAEEPAAEERQKEPAEEEKTPVKKTTLTEAIGAAGKESKRPETEEPDTEEEVPAEAEESDVEETAPAEGQESDVEETTPAEAEEASAPEKPEAGADIAAIVNDVEIPVERLTKNFIAYMDQFGLSAEDRDVEDESIRMLKEAVLEEHIRMELVNQKAAELELEVSKEKQEEFAARAEEFMEYYETEEEKQEALDKGITWQNLYDEAINYELSELLKKELLADIAVTEKEIRAYYDAGYGQKEDAPELEEVWEICEKGALEEAKNKAWAALLKEWEAQAEITRYPEHL